MKLTLEPTNEAKDKLPIVTIEYTEYDNQLDVEQFTEALAGALIIWGYHPNNVLPVDKSY